MRAQSVTAAAAYTVTEMNAMFGAPAQFDLEAVFGNHGSSSALIYRQCTAPQTVLLFVVKNPDKISGGGDLLWVKSGKYANVAP